jgi:hypothetical protein
VLLALGEGAFALLSLPIELGYLASVLLRLTGVITLEPL